MKIVIAWVVISASFLVGCTLGRAFTTPDKYPEEIAEEIIEAYTGADIDLTPGSPEGDHKANDRPGQNCDCQCVTRDDS